MKPETENKMTHTMLVTTEAFETARAYWVEKLTGLECHGCLPADFPGVGQDNTAVEPVVIPFKQAQEMITISKNNDLSLFVLLLTVLKIVLYKVTGEPEVVTVSPTLKHSRQDYNRWVISRDMIRSAWRFKQALIEVKQTVADGYKNQYYPVNKLLQWLNLEPGISLFRVVMLLENIHEKVLPGFWPGEEEFQAEIAFSFKRNDDSSITGNIHYPTGWFKEDTVQTLFQCFCVILEQVMNDLSVVIRDIELVSPQTREELLFTFNQTSRDLPGYQTIHQVFEERVEKNPGEIAVKSTVDIGYLLAAALSQENRQEAALSLEKLKTCFFEMNPYIYRSAWMEVRGRQQSSFALLKTHRHNCLVANRNLVRLIDWFDGNHSSYCHLDLEGIYRQLQGLPITFCFYSMDSADVLEVSHQYQQDAEVFRLENFADFIGLVKQLVDRHVLRPKTSEKGNELIQPAVSQCVEGYFDLHELAPTGLSLHYILQGSKVINPAQVLLLGDTPGTPTTGLLYLASYLRRHGFSAVCQFYDPHLEYNALLTNIRELLEQVQPGIVAISMKWFPYIARVIEIARMVKQFSPHTRVVLGGNTASYYRKEIIGHPAIDYIIAGDGELPLLNICRGEEIIPNATYKQEGKIIEQPMTYVQNWENSADIYLSDLDEILLADYTSLPGTFFIYTHKGCPMNCVYCAGCRSTQAKVFNRPVPFKRSVEQVRKDIIAAKIYSSTLMFDFISTNDALLEYLKQILAGIDLTGHFCIFVNLYPPSPEIIRLLTDAFKYVYWDLDMASLSEPHRLKLFSLGLVKPQPTNLALIDFFDACQSFNNHEVRLNLINGLPYFTEEDIELSRQMIELLARRYSFLSDLHWGRLHAQPGAPIVEEAEKHGMYSRATSYHDFLEFSQINFNAHSNLDFSTVEYPYVYYQNDRLNSLVSSLYVDIESSMTQARETHRFATDIVVAVTYERLNQRANRLAWLLREKGVKPDNLVGLAAEEPITVAEGILGILKSGGAFLPLPSQYPGERIEAMIKDSSILHLVTDSFFPAYPHIATGNMILMRELTGENPGIDVPVINPEPVNTATDLAYVIYTSGTTGRPKGVMVQHGGLLNYTLWRYHAYQYTAKDVALQLLSYSFDGFGSNFYTSIISGGTLVFVPASRRLDFDYLKDIVRRHRVTNASMVPGMYDALLDHLNSEELENFRFVVLAGERADKNLLNKSLQKKSTLLLINEYGPTEATVTAAAHVGMSAMDTSLVGTPIANVRIYIMNRLRQLVPPGMTGEICIAGMGIARGYLNNPGLSNEKFIDNPYITGEKLYCTGDYGKWLPDGRIEYIKRIDGQVKIRGYRVELAEIETRIKEHILVKDAVVGCHADDRDEPYLCAYVVLGEETVPSASERLDTLKKFLAERLPDYMIPAHFQVIDHVPRKIDGKVDRSILKDRVIKTQTNAQTAAPRNKAEIKLVQLWAEVLGIEPESIDIDASFFQLGGHSLKATALISRIHKEMNVKIPVIEIFQNPYIRHLSAFISNIDEDQYYSIEPVEKKEYYPLSSAQQRLYVLQQMDMDSIAYNTTTVVVLKQDVDLLRLEAAFQQLLQRHESLRTSFIYLDKGPVQRVHDQAEIKVEVTDDPGKIKTFIQPFDLSRVPLWRVKLVKNPGGRNLLIIDIHHIITDGRSQEILTKEFVSLYAGQHLTPLRIQYKDFCQWQHSGAVQESIQRQETYWLEQFSQPVPLLDLPAITLGPVAAGTSVEGESIDFVIDEAPTVRLRELARQENVTLFMLLLASLNVLLAKLSGQEDIVVGTPTAGRQHADTGFIVGMFVNTLALRHYPQGHLLFKQFLEQLKKRTLEAFDNQDYPFDYLVARVMAGGKREISSPPLFNIMFAFQEFTSTYAHDLVEADMEPYKPYLPCQLVLTGFDDGKAIRITFFYDRERFTAEMVKNIISYYQEVVVTILDNPVIKLQDITLSHTFYDKTLAVPGGDEDGDFGF